MTRRDYYISNAVEFLGRSWPLPANSLIYWSQGKAGGVLLSPGAQYSVIGGDSFILAVPLQAGDIVSVVSFPPPVVGTAV